MLSKLSGLCGLLAHLYTLTQAQRPAPCLRSEGLVEGIKSPHHTGQVDLMTFFYASSRREDHDAHDAQV
jgi:hypothetical protein